MSDSQQLRLFVSLLNLARDRPEEYASFRDSIEDDPIDLLKRLGHVRDIALQYTLPCFHHNLEMQFCWFYKTKCYHQLARGIMSATHDKALAVKIIMYLLRPHLKALEKIS